MGLVLLLQIAGLTKAGADELDAVKAQLLADMDRYGIGKDRAHLLHAQKKLHCMDSLFSFNMPACRAQREVEIYIKNQIIQLTEVSNDTQVMPKHACHSTEPHHGHQHSAAIGCPPNGVRYCQRSGPEGTLEHADACAGNHPEARHSKEIAGAPGDACSGLSSIPNLKKAVSMRIFGNFRHVFALLTSPVRIACSHIREQAAVCGDAS